MRVLFLGDVVGRPGRRAVARIIPALRGQEGIDFIVANCENASGGKGIEPQAAEELLDAGIDVLTSGNHIWQHRAILPYIAETGRVLRPYNFPPGVPGRGWAVRATRDGVRVAVLNLIGRVFMPMADCPFRAAEVALKELTQQTPVILVDMHAEATSEKIGMGRFLDGRVSAVIGTHTHVQTGDETILRAGTAYMTDAGMCGPEDSVLGMRTDQVLRRFLSQMPIRLEVASGSCVVQGLLLDVDTTTGRATAVRRVAERIET